MIGHGTKKCVPETKAALGSQEGKTIEDQKEARKVNRFPRSPLRLVVFFLIALVIVLADQTTKYLVVREIPLNSGYVVISGFLNVVHIRNTGAAFGFLSEWEAGPFFVLLSFGVIAGLTWIVVASPPMEGFVLVGYSFFGGGTLGNLLDRLRFGEVIDFLDVHWGGLHWPAFNVADSALTVAVGIFLYELLLHRGPKPSVSDISLRS